MSFVITAVRSDTVVQVSDTRHSDLETKAVISEKLRKTFIVKGRQTKFVLGWVGLASNRFGHQTTDWLFKALGEMNAVELTIEQIAASLRELAITRFTSLSTPDKYKHTTFAMAGWQDQEPFICTVSNYANIYNRIVPSWDMKHHVPIIKESAEVFPRFDVTVQRFKEINNRDYVVHVMGDFDPEALNAHFMGLESLLKKRARASEISGCCMQIAMEAAEHSETVGRNLIGVEMAPNGRTMCPVRTETDEFLIPPYLGLDGAHKNGRISVPTSEAEPLKTQATIATFKKIAG